MKATELVNEAIDANRPIDWGYLRHISRTYTAKEQREWARHNIEPFCDGTEKPQTIGRAITLLIDELL